MASFKNLVSTTSAQISSGGTITGSLVVEGDLQVDGGGSLSFDEIVQGTQVIDVTNTEALLVRKNGDGGDILTIDTTNSLVKLGKNGGTPSALNIYGATNGNPLLIYEDTDNSVVLNFYLDSSDNSGQQNEAVLAAEAVFARKIKLVNYGLLMAKRMLLLKVICLLAVLVLKVRMVRL